MKLSEKGPIYQTKDTLSGNLRMKINSEVAKLEDENAELKWENERLREAIRNWSTIEINGKKLALDIDALLATEKTSRRILELEADLMEAINIIVNMQMYALGDVGEYDEEALSFTSRLLTAEEPE